MKYVMFNHNTPICFPDEIVHSSLAYARIGKITSAGFVSTGIHGETHVHGMSESCAIGPEDGDDLILRAFLDGFSKLDILNLSLLGTNDLAVAVQNIFIQREEKYKDENK